MEELDLKRKNNLENVRRIMSRRTSSKTPYWYKLHGLVEKIKDYQRRPGIQKDFEFTSKRRKQSNQQNNGNPSRLRLNSMNSTLKIKKRAFAKIRAGNLLKNSLKYPCISVGQRNSRRSSAIPSKMMVKKNHDFAVEGILQVDESFENSPPKNKKKCKIHGSENNYKSIKLISEMNRTKSNFSTQNSNRKHNLTASRMTANNSMIRDELNNSHKLSFDKERLERLALPRGHTEAKKKRNRSHRVKASQRLPQFIQTLNSGDEKHTYSSLHKAFIYGVGLNQIPLLKKKLNGLKDTIKESRTKSKNFRKTMKYFRIMSKAQNSQLYGVPILGPKAL
eukprot:CAMPEP_0197001802 /NCGR_PEP_ID=MMETSP1380-20130617/6425_1 /TAXON_ID=5936 /ORGANISM="Euplotes crassus, Strain CT5" /LENGTH=334 /DNA_ID=CAMNT_0042419627 /DNA_START=23 /DNA_END=1029 /DNA_ORIENTATION=-